MTNSTQRAMTSLVVRLATAVKDPPPAVRRISCGGVGSAAYLLGLQTALCSAQGLAQTDIAQHLPSLLY